jgi:hypothetical protein
MSRSRRKTCIAGATLCQSEKKDKADNHRRERRSVRMAVARGDELMPHYLDSSNRWSMGKDGRVYFGNWDSDSVSKMRRK